jgi:hypothetical protein
MHTFIKIIIITTLCLATQIMYAQDDNLLQSDSTYIDSNLTKFAGTWRSVNGADTVTVLLKKVSSPCGKSYNNCFIEKLIGYHEYKRGNTIVESSMHLQNITPSIGNQTLIDWGYLLTNGQIDYNKFEFSFYDISKDRKHFSVIMTINAAQNQLTWLLKVGRNMHRKNLPAGATFPRNMIFNKVP